MGIYEDSHDEWIPQLYELQRLRGVWMTANTLSSS